MYKTLLASAIGLVLSATTMANSYQFEGSASYLNSKYSDGVDAEADGLFATGTYYFSPVTTDKHPLREAAFLAKGGSASLIYAHLKTEANGFFDFSSHDAKVTVTGKNTALIFSADGYLFDGLIYVGGAATHSKSKHTSIQEDIYTNPSFSTKTTDKEEETSDIWRVNLGIAPTTGLLIWSGFEKDVDITDSWNLNAKYLIEFNSKALSLQGGIGESSLAILDTASVYPINTLGNFTGEDESGVNSAYILGDYYFDNTFSLGLGATYVDSNNDDEDNTYLIRGQKFFTDSFSVLVQYNQSSDYDSFSIGASLRF